MTGQDLSLHTDQGSFTYRVAAIIIQDNKILLVKHDDHPCYYTVGGRVKLNETSEEAVIREAYEETAAEYQIDRLAFIQERFFELSGERYHEICFYYILNGAVNIDLSNRSYTDQGPKEKLVWVPIEQLDNTNLVPEVLKTMLKNKTNFLQHIITKE